MWEGKKPEKCELCGSQIGKEFVDGAVKGRESWHVMCLRCAKRFGLGLGPGKGQKYALLVLAGTFVPVSSK